VKQTSTNSTYDIPLSFGAGVRVGLSPKWSIGTGVNYSMLSRKFFGTYTQVNNLGLVENTTSSDIRNTQHYIGIPVNAYYDIVDSRNVNFYAYAGGTVEKCISDKYSVLNTSIIHKEIAEGFQWSANVGIGVGFKLSEHLGLYIDPSLRYYFDCGQPYSIRSAQPLMLGFEVGLKLYL
jgi:opacity protein-like surface antigen